MIRGALLALALAVAAATPAAAHKLKVFATVKGEAVTAETAALIEAAVQHQVAPLLERIEAMDDRLRLTDVMSGIFLIVGLAGIGLWARSRGQGGGRRP